MASKRGRESLGGGEKQGREDLKGAPGCPAPRAFGRFQSPRTLTAAPARCAPPQLPPAPGPQRLRVAPETPFLFLRILPPAPRLGLEAGAESAAGGGSSGTDRWGPGSPGGGARPPELGRARPRSGRAGREGASAGRGAGPGSPGLPGRLTWRPQPRAARRGRGWGPGAGWGSWWRGWR